MKKTWLFNAALLLVCVLCVPDSCAQDDNLPEGTIARLENLRHRSPVYSVAFSPDGKTLASGSEHGTVRLWEVGSGQLKTTLQGNKHDVYSISFSPDGTTLASGDSRVLLWEVGSGQLKTTLQGYEGDDVYSVAFSPDGTILASGDSRVLLWEIDSGQLKTILGYGSGAYWVTFSPDGKTLASGSWDGTIRLWEVRSGQLKTTLQGHKGGITSVSFSPDGTILASGSRDGTIRLWEVRSGQQKAILKDTVVTSVAFSPDGKILASGNWDLDFTVRLWEVRSGQLKTTLQGHEEWVSSVSFSPDGTTLASGSGDGTVLLWDMSPYITPSVPTAIQPSPPLPTQTALLANFPNPFNPDTYIPYQLHAPAQVRLSIYDVRGALIREIDLGYRVAGQYLTSASAAHWDGRDRRGQRVASGVYLYRLQAGPVTQVRKMVVVK